MVKMLVTAFLQLTELYKKLKIHMFTDTLNKSKPDKKYQKQWVKNKKVSPPKNLW